MKLGLRRGRPLAAGSAAGSATIAMCACALLGVCAPAVAATASARTPDLATGSAYLAARSNLIAGHYYESFPGSADFGLTIDGALALAATGDDDQALRTIVAFIDRQGKDPSGRTVNDWTGIGTADASGGSIGKEALLAEVVGDNPRRFGGRNLIAALDASVCTRPSAAGSTSCPGTGSYLNDTSVFDQALGIIAQLRAGQASDAASPVTYLESLQSTHGSFPSLIPPSGGPDVDSTAIAVMALALARGHRAADDVRAGLAWLAGKQERNGGFPTAGAESTNSTGLAIQALTVHAAHYRTRIRAALAFLAREQNSNGGFDADAGQHSSNLRASTQAVGGAAGTSFGTLRRPLSTRVPDSHPSGDATGNQKGNDVLGAGAGGSLQSPEPRGSTAAPGTSPGRAISPAPGALRPQRSQSAAVTRYRAALASDQSAGLPAAVIWPPIGLIVVGLLLGLLLSWRRRYRTQAGQPAPAAPSAPPFAESLPSPEKVRL